MYNNNYKLALTGLSGSGKDTFVKIVKQNKNFEDVQEIKLAKPLYDMQEFIYLQCNKQKNYWLQDGQLLSFLGNHVRKINPTIMRDYFVSELRKISKNNQLNNQLIICSDARLEDLPYLKLSNFIIIKIIANDTLRQIRCHQREDISLGIEHYHNNNNATAKEVVDYYITNNSDNNSFSISINKLMKEIYDTYRK